MLLCFVRRISLFLSEPQIAAFQALSRQAGRPYAELVREALDEYLRRKGVSQAIKAERLRAGTRKRS